MLLAPPLPPRSPSASPPFPGLTAALLFYRVPHLLHPLPFPQFPVLMLSVFNSTLTFFSVPHSWHSCASCRSTSVSFMSFASSTASYSTAHSFYKEAFTFPIAPHISCSHIASSWVFHRHMYFSFMTFTSFTGPYRNAISFFNILLPLQHPASCVFMQSLLMLPLHSLPPP